MMHRYLFGLAAIMVQGMPMLAHADEHMSEPSNAPISALTKLQSLANAAIQPTLNTPAVQEFRTKSGTRVLFVAAPELPIVDLRLTFDAGSARDTSIAEGLYGLASMTAQLLDEGTSTQNTDQIAAQFESIGAQYSAAAYRDMFTIDLRSLSDPQYLNPATEQLLLILKDAQFPQSSIDRVMQNFAIGQRQREESPSSIASIRFWRELYGHHPYAEPSTGTQASLKKIKREHLLAFKQQFLVAKNLNIAITGQLSLKQAKQLAEQITAQLATGTHAAALPDAPAMQQARQVYVPFDSTQTHIMIGQRGVTRDTPELAALNVGNDILGGGDFNALLMKELREKRGLTYGAYSGFTTMRSQGPFTISYSTRADQAQQSLEVTRQTLKDFMQSPLDAGLVEEAKIGILNAYPLSLASNENINGMLSMMGFYGFPTTYLADYPKRISQVTNADIQHAFNTYVQPDQMLTVIVGQALTPSNTNPSTLPAATPASQPDALSTVPQPPLETPTASTDMPIDAPPTTPPSEPLTSTSTRTETTADSTSP